MRFILLTLLLASTASGDAITDWVASCPTPDADGLCVKSVKLVGACQESAERVVARGSGAAAALEQLRRAGVGHPRILLGDALIEKVFVGPVPATDTKSMTTWVEQTKKSVDAARSAYEVIVGDDKAAPDERVLAAERLGRLWGLFADAVESIPIPKEVTGGDAKEAYCEELEKVTDPIREQAKQAYLYCASSASKLSVTAPRRCAVQP